MIHEQWFGKDVEGSGRDLTWSTIPEFVWRNWGKSRNSRPSCFFILFFILYKYESSFTEMWNDRYCRPRNFSETFPVGFHKNSSQQFSSCYVLVAGRTWQSWGSFYRSESTKNSQLECLYGQSYGVSLTLVDILVGESWLWLWLCHCCLNGIDANFFPN